MKREGNMATQVGVMILLCVLALVAVEAKTTPSTSPSSPSSAPDYIPTVLWHGMGDTCCNPFSMGRLKRLIERELPGVYVHSIKVGKNILDDEVAGFLGNVSHQVESVALQLAADPALSRGFNAVGFSQGGQFLRAFVERFNNPKVFNLVTLGAQHQGVFGFPRCPVQNEKCELIRQFIDIGVYLPAVQAVSVQSQYWHDALNETDYLKGNVFLPDINNNNQVNSKYRNNMLSLRNFAMVQFLNDTMVIPRISELFGFYAPGQDKVEQALEDTPLYKEDWLGLQALDRSGRLQQIKTIGDHLQFTNEWFIDHVINPYLNQTFSN